MPHCGGAVKLWGSLNFLTFTYLFLKLYDEITEYIVLLTLNIVQLYFIFFCFSYYFILFNYLIYICGINLTSTFPFWTRTCENDSLSISQHKIIEFIKTHISCSYSRTFSVFLNLTIFCSRMLHFFSLHWLFVEILIISVTDCWELNILIINILNNKEKLNFKVVLTIFHWLSCGTWIKMFWTALD